MLALGHHGSGHKKNGYRTNGAKVREVKEITKVRGITKQNTQKCKTELSSLTLTLKEIADHVKEYRGERISLKSPKDFTLRITDLDGTIFWGRQEMLETWGELYLPEPEKMVVLGAIDNISSLAEGLQLIVLVDSKKRVYFYENEVLHLVAYSVKDFLNSGAESSPIESFRYGQHCAPKTEEEYLDILKNAGIPRIDKSTRDFVQSKGKDLSDLLDFLEDL